MQYYVVLERASDGGWGAYPPDLPGVGVTGSTREEALENVKLAIELHLEGMKEDGVPIAAPLGQFVDVAVA